MKDPIEKTDSLSTQSLKNSELRYRRLFEESRDGILILNARTGLIDDVNPYLINMLGYSREEFIEKKLWEMGAFKDINASHDAFEILQRDKYIRYEDLPLKTKDGQLIQVEFISNVYLVGDHKVIQCNIRDDTEHKRIIAALQENEKTYHDLINLSQDGFFVIGSSGNILTVNNAICMALGYSNQELLGMNIWEIIPKKYLDQYTERLTRILKGKSLAEGAEYIVHGKDGKEHYVDIISVPHYSGKEIVGFQGIAHDITARKHAEATLQKNEFILSQSQRIAHIGSWSWDLTGPVVWTDETYHIYGLSQKNFTPSIESFIKLVHPEDRSAMQNWVDACLEGKSPANLVFRTFLPDGSIRFIVGSGDLLYDAENKPYYLTGTVQDITELKHQEQKLADLAKFPAENPNPVLRLNRNGIIMYANPSSDSVLELWGCEVGSSAPRYWCELVAHAHINQKSKTVEFECDGKIYSMIVTPVAGTDYITIYGHDISDLKRSEAALLASESKFRSYIENAPLGVFVADGSGRYVEVNKTAHEMLGYTMSELIQLSIPDILAPQALEEGMQSFKKLSQDGFINEELMFQHKDGSQFWSTVLAVKLSEDLFMSFCQDITERKQADEKIRKQFAHLTALSAIDRTIAASFDIKFTLSEIINHLMAELGIDAAAILILNSSSKLLEYGAAGGFRTKAVREASVRMGDSYAGLVALKRQFIQISMLVDDPDNLFLPTFFKGEGFVYYRGVPLITRGIVMGVLEVFQRTALVPDPEWLNFLNTLAGQAALAIENASLFENLRRSNMELSLAYDATIEGWSKALDLRDKETEGHTLRVTEMTVDFARNFGLSEDELVQTRRGALLHDIGKMGVPDRILLKPGPLTDEEWVKMRKHPTFSYELLSPIRYLQQALDIPYCHHEKWDGSGYPRGLKGTQIPLAARIFAVVDVWDALTSDRPYRPAWTKEKANEFIRNSSGTHLDPQVVDVFLKKVPDEK